MGRKCWGERCPRDVLRAEARGKITSFPLEQTLLYNRFPQGADSLTLPQQQHRADMEFPGLLEP